MSKIMKFPRRRVKYRFRVLLGITLFLALSFFLFGSILVKSYIDRNNELRMAELAKNTENILGNMENSLMTIHKYYLASEDNDEVRFLVENDVDYSKVSAIDEGANTLLGGGIVSDYVGSYSLVNFRTGIVLGSKGRYEVSEAKNLDKLIEIYEAYKEKYTKNMWIYIDGEDPDKYSREYRTTVPINGLDLILFVPYSEVTPYALVVVNINLNQLTSDIRRQMGPFENAALYSSEGKLLYTSSKDLSDIISQNDVDYGNTIVTKNADGKRIYVHAGTVGVAGLKLYVSNESVGFEYINNAYSLMTVVLVLLLLLIAATLLYRSIYRPIKSAAMEIAGANNITFLPGEDELSYLTDSVKKLDSRNTALISHTTTLFAIRLYRDELTAEEIDQYIYRLSLSPKIPDKFKILTFVLRSLSEDVAISTEEDKRTCNEIIEKINAQFPTKELLPPVYYAKAIVMFVKENSADKVKEEIERRYNFFTQYVYNNFKMNIGMGVSQTCEDIHQVGQAYRESVYALHLGKTDSGSYLNYYRTEGGMSLLKYDIQQEEELKRSLRRGDKQGAYRILDVIFGRIIDENASRDCTIPVLLQLVNSIVMDVQASGLGTDIFRENLREIYPEIIDYHDLNRLRKNIKFNMVDPIIHHQNELLANQSGNIMAAIEQLVEDKEGNITLNECSDILSYHSSYIWRVLKEEKNMTFTEYVEAYKINYAKKLLKDTDMTVGAIAEKLNYTNAQNFIRFFSKLEGTTPGKYRAALKEA